MGCIRRYPTCLQLYASRPDGLALSRATQQLAELCVLSARGELRCMQTAYSLTPTRHQVRRRPTFFSTSDAVAPLHIQEKVRGA